MSHDGSRINGKTLYERDTNAGRNIRDVFESGSTTCGSSGQTMAAASLKSDYVISLRNVLT